MQSSHTQKCAKESENISVEEGDPAKNEAVN